MTLLRVPWSLTGEMSVARSAQTLTVLPDGKVLVVAGFQWTAGGGFPHSSCELYDPASGSWTPTGSLAVARTQHSALLLPDGTVLVAGGWGSGRLASCELYDPATGNWSPVGDLTTARNFHAAALLGDGTVLVAGGGTDGSDATSSCEVYDPATQTWGPTGSLEVAVGGGAGAVRLADGSALLTGGRTADNENLDTSHLYDPASRTWTLMDPMASARGMHTATTLNDGTALVAGSAGGDGSELFHP